MLRNQTVVTEFFFTGLTSSFQLQILLFLLFLCVYVVMLLGNLGMAVLIRLDTRLHIPMYFLLSHLSLVDACSSLVISPKMLSDIFVERKLISFLGCAVQLCLFSQFVVTECFLLASMAHDRYVAICKPLLYTRIMSQRVCVLLVIGPYGVALISTMVHTTFAFLLPYCGPNLINHFFCDLLPVFSLACADTQVNKLLLFVLAGILGVFSGIIILVSYIYNVMTILKIHSADGRRKAFSTCSSHLIAVSILYGTLFFIYVCPSTSFSQDMNKVVSLFYTTVIPMLNLFIYSLRNKEVKEAFIRTFKKKFCYNLQAKMLLI